MTRYANCFNCAVDKATCPRRATLRKALAGAHVYSVKFKCDDRRPMFSTGQRVQFRWVWWDDGDGYPLTFNGTVLRERGSKFVVQVDSGASDSDEGIKAGPTCYHVEGAAEDRCYGSDYYRPTVCVRGISREPAA